jgi:hypothetical protein
MAGVMATIFSFFAANATKVFPKTSWYLLYAEAIFLFIFPVKGSNFPGA